jgi:Uma2 family endonuclease
MSTRALTTVEQFAQMQTADTEDYELVEGELIPLSSGTLRHARIRGLAERLVNTYFDRNPIGEAYAEVDCRVSEEEVRRPDLSIFLNETLSRIDLDKIPAPVAPDIAVEVLSPSEGAIDLRHKVRDYLRGGSREVWLLDRSNGEVQVNTGSGIRVIEASDVLESPLLPGFSVTVADLIGA